MFLYADNKCGLYFEEQFEFFSIHMNNILKDKKDINFVC